MTLDETTATLDFWVVVSGKIEPSNQKPHPCENRKDGAPKFNRAPVRAGELPGALRGLRRRAAKIGGIVYAA